MLKYPNCEELLPSVPLSERDRWPDAAPAPDPFEAELDMRYARSNNAFGMVGLVGEAFEVVDPFLLSKFVDTFDPMSDADVGRTAMDMDLIRFEFMRNDEFNGRDGGGTASRLDADLNDDL